MKKFRKKISYITKVFLVLSLIFSNLSSLSVVFAYEATDDFTVIVTEENKIKINYLEELDDTDVINVLISENYTYLNNKQEDTVTNSFATTGEEVSGEIGLEVLSSMLSKVLFDGLYELSVSLYNVTDDVELGTVLYSENIEHDAGLKITVTDSEGKVVNLTDDIYLIANGIVNVKSKVLAGGLVPKEVYTIEGVNYTAEALLDLEFDSSFDLSGRLYGKYTLPVEVMATNENLEEVKFTQDILVGYNTYADNTLALNNKLNEVIPDSSYLFEGDEKEGILYVMPNETTPHSVLDIINVLDEYVLGNDKITYVVSNSEYDSIKDAYLEYVATGEISMTEEEYYSNIVIDDTTVITLISEGQIVTYKVVVFADLNNDGLLTEKDLLLLIDQSVGITDVTLEKSDMNDDLTLDLIDAICLYNTLITGSWENTLEENDGTLDARLEVLSEDIVSGDMFSVNYILTLNEYKTNGISGLVKYDNTVLELVSVNNMTTWNGSDKDGKFLYLGEEALTGTITETEEQTDAIYEDKEYVVLTLTFKALRADSTVVEIENPRYADGMSLLDTTELEVSTEVIINKSTDNSLSSLKVSGQEIELKEEVLEYTVSVSNETTEVLVEALVNNLAASISSIVAPEELAEGENTITIVVMAENGDEKVYTIKVIREESPKEGTTQVTYQSTDTEEEETVIIPNDDVNKPVVDEKDDEIEEESKLSRIIIIILILLVVVGLIYLIFKDDNDDEETKKINKDINKMKKNNDFKQPNDNTKVDKGKNNKKGR